MHQPQSGRVQLHQEQTLDGNRKYQQTFHVASNLRNNNAKNEIKYINLNHAHNNIVVVYTLPTKKRIIFEEYITSVS